SGHVTCRPPGARRGGRIVSAPRARETACKRLLAPAAPNSRRPRLLAGAGIAVQRAALDGLVDRLHKHPVLVVGRWLIPSLDRPRKPAEVGLDPRRVAPVLEPLALSAQDPLLLGMDIGHRLRQSKAAAEGPRRARTIARWCRIRPSSPIRRRR